MNCPYCGSEIRESAQYCNQCGRNLTEKTNCSDCQHLNSTGAKFCTACGASLSPWASQSLKAYRYTKPSLPTNQFSSENSPNRSVEKANPPYWYATLLIVAGLFTVTIIPSIIGVFSMIKCIKASNANQRWDYEEAKKLSRQAIWNPVGIPAAGGWVIGIIIVIAIIGAIIVLSEY